MRLNPAPLLMLPGACIVGALVAGWSGVWVAASCWAGFVLLATVLHVVSACVHCASEMAWGGPDGDADALPSRPAARNANVTPR